MDILIVILALMGLVLIPWGAGAGLKSLFHREMSTEEFCKMLRDLQEERDRARGIKPAGEFEEGFSDTIRVKVDFSEDRSLYRCRTAWGNEGTIKRYSDYNIIYEFKYSNPWYQAVIVNQKWGLRHVCSNRVNPWGVLFEAEQTFKEWSKKYSDREFRYENG